MRALLLLFVLSAQPCLAAEYSQPPGAPEIFLPDHNVTVSIFAVQTPVGHGIGILEKRDGAWFLCGRCLVAAEVPSLDAAVKAAGGAERFLASKIEAINAVLAARYPARTSRRSENAFDEVDKALSTTTTLRLVNGVPQLGAP